MSAAMDDLSRSEYPALLATLQPNQAVQALHDRVKRINKINVEVAEWLQERRKVEEQYVAGLRKLLLFKVPNPASELGVFQGPWDKILQSTDAVAASHHLYAQRIEKDVELPLRSFHMKKEMANMSNISGNLSIMAKELEDAQDKSERLNKKGGKANAQKVEAALARLESASQQWESQAPFVFETLQALDEQRINHLRDVLTQYETHEVDQATRAQATAEETLNVVLEISTEQEIQTWASRMSAGRPKLERRTGTRQSSVVASSTLAPPPSAPAQEDDTSEPSLRNEPHQESRLRSRIGTMLGRRRQSIHGGFGQLSPSKSSGPFGRGLSSSHGRSISPRASSQNLGDSNNRLSSLAETPDTPRPSGPNESKEKPSHDGTNGAGEDAARPLGTVVNGTVTAEDIFDAPPPDGPPPQQKAEPAEPQKDSEGFTIPTAKDDPITQAQKEAAAEEPDQVFKLNIQNEPVGEEDADAKQAAISSVANTLSMAMPSRKAGTVRGRRDVRNTIYGGPAGILPESSSEAVVPTPSPALSSLISKPSAVAALASEASVAATSDTQSVRSATSLGSLTQVKHPDMHTLGLNSSIIETVSATFEEGEVKSAKVSGEIAFSYITSLDTPSKDRETIRINSFPSLEVIGPNRIFVQNSPSPDEFTLDTAHLQKTAVAFTYRLHADDPTALAAHCPLALQPAWKPNGDKLGFVLQYRLNPSAAARFPAPVTLHNVVFVATYQGARASGAQTKPAGTHLKDKHLVYWRMGELTLTGDWAKIVARIVGEQNGEPTPGHVEARWEYAAAAGTEAGAPGISVSRLVESKGKEKAVEVDDDPFADESTTPRTEERNWVEVPLAKRLASGRYEAK